jgi:hypothetical protein
MAGESMIQGGIYLLAFGVPLARLYKLAPAEAV